MRVSETMRDLTKLRTSIDRLDYWILLVWVEAATVLGGALLEALLLDTLSDKAQTALSKKSAPKREKKVVEDLNEWGLHSCIEVAEEMGLITKSTCQLGLLAKDARNLIHPGRAIRLELEFNSATAHTVKAALESVICDLQKWYEA